ncbi:DNA polymerase/3'-5' exonuclease PolX [Actinomadura madurae]|uniref:DNA polymerase/3'-5' exonuclease PolX n=1 Tax=Actinomadura madurae TaxID=1993 RepID=UPI0020D2027A|nr:DNA polymerase/3'-5' exonuclease PolX [Actinomadura madurae]MCP9947919.1 DNA polymerase/3'-5' exonuclease PolX [Actinomadura madurae]MCP9964693.1 DNA polymerase/3'-5' exonuclease PolX [Actinomadura madurae]MCQ0011320.1 DNA polymerase/3'-5' exonuclease PolX [Actinomadura madurae]
MARANDEAAALIQELADLLSITGGDAFKIRAYEKAARAIAGHPDDISELDLAGLRKIPTVGEAIAKKVLDYTATGTIRQVEELRTQIPAGVRALTAIPTLGPKKALAVYEELGISSVDELGAAIKEGRLRGLKGFGAKTEENILRGIELMESSGTRVLVDAAASVADEVVATLSRLPQVERCAHAGSLRRMRETIGDVDVLAASRDPRPIMEAFTALPFVAEVIAGGDKKTSVRTAKGLQVDLRVVPPESWGAALQYFTGSQAHNIRTREIAVKAGLKLSEYGLFDAETGELIVSETEEEVYERLGLPWVHPALREDTGEIEAALEDELPRLVTVEDLRGDLHSHTDLTDGVASLEDMVAAAHARGLEYYAITDHAPNLVMQRMTDEKMLAQRVKVAELQKEYPGLRLLHGTELNIDPDGGVDWDADFLSGFDVCVASVHSHFTQDQDAMTRRLVRACENPHVHVIGHPTARSIGRRPPVDADWDEVFRAAARTGTAMEIDSFPDRLDLPADLIRRAKRLGVKFSIDTDAHSLGHHRNIRYGVGTAQRGWLTPDDVVNTWPLERLREFLRKR